MVIDLCRSSTMRFQSTKCQMAMISRKLRCDRVRYKISPVFVLHLNLKLSNKSLLIFGNACNALVTCLRIADLIGLRNFF